MVRIHVLMAANVIVIRGVVPCNLVQVYRRFSDASYFHHQGISATSVYFCHTIWRNIPQDINLR
jgi:hypothetical protein